MPREFGPPDVILTDDTRRNLVVGAVYVPFGVILLVFSAFLRWCDDQKSPKSSANNDPAPNRPNTPGFYNENGRPGDHRLSSDSFSSPPNLIVRPGDGSTANLDKDSACVPQARFTSSTPTSPTLHVTKHCLSSPNRILNSTFQIPPAAEPSNLVSIDMSDVPLSLHRRRVSTEHNLLTTSDIISADTCSLHKSQRLAQSFFSNVQTLSNRMLKNVQRTWSSARPLSSKTPSEPNVPHPPVQQRNSRDRHNLLLNRAIHGILINMGIQFLLLGFYPIFALFPPLASTKARISDNNSIQIEDTVALSYKDILPTGTVVIYIILRLVVMITAFIAQSLGEAVMIYKFQRLYPSPRTRLVILPIAGVCIILRSVTQIIVNIQLLLMAVKVPLPHLETFFGAAGCVYFGTMALIVILLSASFFYKFLGRWKRHISASAQNAAVSSQLQKILAATFYHTVIPAIAALVAAVAFPFSSNGKYAYIAQPIYMAAAVVYKTLFALGIALSVYHMLHDRVRPPSGWKGLMPGMELIEAEPGRNRTLWMTECDTPCDETGIRDPDILNLWRPSIDFQSNSEPESPTVPSPGNLYPPQRRNIERTHSPRVRLNLISTTVGRQKYEPSSGTSRKTKTSLASSAGPPRLSVPIHTAFAGMFTSIGGGDNTNTFGGMSVGDAAGAAGATSLIEQEQITSLSMVLAGRNSPEEVIKTFLKYAQDYVSPAVDFFPAEKLRQRDPALPAGALRAFREVRCTVATKTASPEAANGSVRVATGTNSERERTQMMYMPVFFRAQRLGVVVFGPWAPSGSTVTSKITGTLPEGRARNFLRHVVAQLAAYLFSAQLRHQLDSTIVEMQERMAAVEAAAKAKSMFLANMSHEVRTPAAQVIQAVNLLSDSKLTADQTENVHIIQRSGEQLLAILNDILDYSKLENGKIRFENRPFDLYEAVHLSVDLFVVPSKRLDIAYHIDRSLPRTIIGDVTRMRQIFNNLLSNAIKFTDVGCVMLMARNCTDSDTPDGHVKMTFSVVGTARLCTWLLGNARRIDSGCGIPANKLDVIFERFEQSDETNSDHSAIWWNWTRPVNLSISMWNNELAAATLPVLSAEEVKAAEAARKSSLTQTVDVPPLNLNLRIRLTCLYPKSHKVDPAKPKSSALTYAREVLKLQLQTYGDLEISKCLTDQEVGSTLPDGARVVECGCKDDEVMGSFEQVDNDVIVTWCDSWPPISSPELVSAAKKLNVPLILTCESTADAPMNPFPDSMALLTRPFKQSLLMRNMYQLVEKGKESRSEQQMVHRNENKPEQEEQESPPSKPLSAHNESEHGGTGAMTPMKHPIAASVATSPDKGNSTTNLAESGPSGGLSVLVVDDNPINRRMMSRIVASLGHKVVVAENGKESVDLVRSEDFHCVFMDVRMPIMDGFEATRRIIDYYSAMSISQPDMVRRRPTILGLSADAMDEQEAQGLEAGMDFYLRKPLLKKDMAQVLNKISAKLAYG